MNAENIKILGEFQGLANDMGDFFAPNDAIDCILVRRGWIKHKEKGRVWALLAGTKLGGSLQYILYYKDNIYDKFWTVDGMLCNRNFQNLITQTFDIKTV